MLMVDFQFLLNKVFFLITSKVGSIGSTTACRLMGSELKPRQKLEQFKIRTSKGFDLKGSQNVSPPLHSEGPDTKHIILNKLNSMG